MGNRPADLRPRARVRCSPSADVELDVVVVGNGWHPVGLPAGVRGHGLPENLGIPAGRNAGVPLVDGRAAVLPRRRRRAAATTTCWPGWPRQFAADPQLGLIQPRVVDPDGRPAPRRWTPRVRVGDPAPEQPGHERLGGRGGHPAGGLRLRRGWPEPFWYAHEGIELAWRVWDGGCHVRYDGEIEVHHPAIQPTRHAEFYRFQARNRVWLARRNLPAAGRPALRR